MEKGFSDPVPVREFDTEFKSRMGALDEMLLVDAEILDELNEGRHGGFTNTDGPDLIRLDKFNFEYVRSKIMRQYRGCNPAGGAPPTITIFLIGFISLLASFYYLTSTVGIQELPKFMRLFDNQAQSVTSGTLNDFCDLQSCGA